MKFKGDQNVTEIFGSYINDFENLQNWAKVD
jgi:hypothetical protein